MREFKVSEIFILLNRDALMRIFDHKSLNSTGASLVFTFNSQREGLRRKSVLSEFLDAQSPLRTSISTNLYNALTFS